jgi:uncharacterized membrane protein HdeD (DUF308 family)
MSKITAILVTLIGLLMFLNLFDWAFTITYYNDYIIAIAIIIIGIVEIIANFKKK